MGPHSNDLVQLFLAERSRILRLLRKIVGSSAVAEDLAQDTLLRLWGRPVTSADRGLLFQTAKNLAIDYLRGQRVRHTHHSTLAPEQAGVAFPQQDEAMASREELQLFVAALESLPERAQRVFLLNRLDGLSYGIIATRLGISVSTVEKDMMLALKVARDWERRNRNT